MAKCKLVDFWDFTSTIYRIYDPISQIFHINDELYLVDGLLLRPLKEFNGGGESSFRTALINLYPGRELMLSPYNPNGTKTIIPKPQ